MISNGLQLYGEPRIGDFADHRRPELLHNEINAWQHILNLIYKKALNRNAVDLFLRTLSSSGETTENVQVQQSPVLQLLTTPHQEGVGESQTS